MIDEFRIRIVFADPVKSSVHRIRNMGEDLWGQLRDNKKCRIDLGEIDRAVDVISFSVRATRLKAVVIKVKQVLREHMMEREARIEIE